VRCFARPVVIFSRCLGFAACRYDGEIVIEPVVEALKPYVEARSVCPEVAIGLGLPRDPIRLVARERGVRLIQPSTGRDLTGPMRRFAESFLETLDEVDGFILKAGSPSCGLRDAKVHPGARAAKPVSRASGLFAEKALERFPDLPILSEKGFTRSAARRHALTRLFAAASFRFVKGSAAVKDLVRFHSKNKLLLLAHNETDERAMGRLVATVRGRPFEGAISEYEAHLRHALSRPPRRGGHANVLEHALGYFSERLSREEKASFLESLDGYREGRVDLAPCRERMRAWIARFEEPYLAAQTYFEPFPGGLVENVAQVPDASGRRRRSSSP